ncbi:hypothetical protein B2J93_3688 [Marssonina coronariae]|uniref:Uncharacterized protein n=1 Tax=Diplocarpon coronariae TaxID=2795749 RepID=A0A218Z5L6_9HELO|nr:hypothetical protein B2J93_3688 [Marssonina coronariae]
MARCRRGNRNQPPSSSSLSLALSQLPWRCNSHRLQSRTAPSALRPQGRRNSGHSLRAISSPVHADMGLSVHQVRYVPTWVAARGHAMLRPKNNRTRTQRPGQFAMPGRHDASVASDRYGSIPWFPSQGPCVQMVCGLDSLRIRTCSPSIFGYRACGQQDRHTPLPVTSAPPCTTPSTTSTSTSTSSSSISSSSSSSTGCPVRWSCAAAMPVSSRLVSRARGRCRTWIIVGSRKSRSPLLFPCSEQSKGRPWRPTLNQMRSVQIASSGKILPSVQAGVWLLRPSQRRHALPLQSCLDTGSLSTTCQMPAHNRSQITNGAYDGIVSRIELRPSPLASSHLPTIYLRAATSPDFRIAYPTTRRDETRRSNTERAPLPEAAAQPRTEI